MLKQIRRMTAGSQPAKAWGKRLTIRGVTDLEKVEQEVGRYVHALLGFGARQKADGQVELVIRVKDGPEGLHTYYAPLHPRDIAHAQFPWTFQRYLYDCMHDYMVELFVHTPQSRDARPLE